MIWSTLTSTQDTSSCDLYKLDTPERCSARGTEPCSACTKIELLDESADKPSFRIARERIDLLRQANEQHDPFIIRLPLEIAYLIFELCIPSLDNRTQEEGEGLLNYYRRDISRIDFKKSPIVPQILSHVCHQWRRVAFSTPRLWTALPISLRKSNNERQLGILQQWARRSGGLPLSIGLWSDEVWYKPGKNHVWARLRAWKQTFDFVNSLAPRWKVLQLLLPGFALPWIEGNGQFPSSFEHLDILGCRFSKDVTDEHPRVIQSFRLNGLKPRPTRLSVRCMHYKNVHIEWSSIAVLELDEFWPEDCRTILREIPQLHTLSLSTIAEDMVDWEEDRVVHPALQVLRVYDVITTDGDCFLDTLTFPGLVEFKFWRDYGRFEDAVSLLTRSRCSLKKCMIEDSWKLGWEEFGQFLRLPILSSLDHLSVSCSIETINSLLEALNVGPTDHDDTVKPLLPELDILALEPRIEDSPIGCFMTFWSLLHSLVDPCIPSQSGLAVRVRTLKSVRIVVDTSSDEGKFCLSSLITSNNWDRRLKDGRKIGAVVSIEDFAGQMIF